MRGDRRMQAFYSMNVFACSVYFCACAIFTNSLEHGVPIEIKLWDTGRTPLAHMVDVTNEFGLKVLAEHNFLNDNNIAFSPYGLMGIMVALYEGVDGESSYQIQKGMQLPWNRNVMRIGFRDIHRTLKTYFVPEEGFLAGLALNNENVTFNEQYKKILRFYGFDLENDQLPTLSPESNNTSNVTSNANSTIAPADSGDNKTTAMLPENKPTTPSDKEETTSTTNPNAETINTIDIRQDTSTTTGQSSAPNAESTTMSSSTNTMLETKTIESITETVSLTTITTRQTTTSQIEITTEAMTTTDQTVLTSTQSVTTPVPEETTTTAPSTVTITTKSSTQTSMNEITEPGTTTITLSTVMSTDTVGVSNTLADGSTTDSDMHTATMDITSQMTTLGTSPSFTTITSADTMSSTIPLTTDSSTITSTGIMEDTTSVTSISTQQTDQMLTIIDMSTSVNSVTPMTNKSTLENLERRKRSIVDFIFTNPPYIDDYLYYRSYDIGSEVIKPNFDDEMFLANGFKSVQVTYMHYNTVLEYAFLPHLEATALRLPLDSDRYYLLVVLPQREGPAELGRLMSRMARESDLSDIYSVLRPRRVKGIVPSFTVKGHITLTTDLQKLGIRDVFEPRQRDFTPMTKQTGVYVRSIEQAVSVAIRKYRPDDQKKHRYVTNRDPVVFSATYPFLYFVMDANIHVSLMAGKMVDPLNSRIL